MNGFSEQVNEHKVLAVALSMAVIVVALAYLFVGRRQPVTAPLAGPVYYYDLVTSQVFVAPDAPPPIATPSGTLEGEPAGVRAYLFTCNPADPKATFIGYLEKFTAEAHGAAIEEASQPPGDGPPRVDPGRDRFYRDGKLIRREYDLGWATWGSDRGQEILAEINMKCDGEPAQEVYPPASALAANAPSGPDSPAPTTP